MTAIIAEQGPDAGIGWHYSDPAREQRALASGAGIVDLSNRGIVTIAGPDRLTWLHALTTQRFETLGDGESTTAYILSPTGHIEHVLFVVHAGERLWIWTEPGRATALADWLRSMQFMTRVEIDVPDDIALVWHGDGVTFDAVARRTGADSLGGHEAFVRRADLAQVMSLGTPAGTWAYEARRIELGIPRIGIDTDGRTIPNELGVPSAAVELDKGCYRGQETVARVHNLGKPPRRLVRLLLDGSVEELPEVGAELLGPEGGRPVGFVGASAWHHELGPIALGLVKRSVDPAATLVAGRISAAQEPLVDPESGLHFRPSLR